MLLDVFTAPLRTHDLAMAAQVHPSLKPNDVLVADRGFCIAVRTISWTLTVL